MEGLFERLLTYYGLSREEYEKLILPPSFRSIPLIDDHPIVKKAIERLEKARDAKEKILIYGDYDADGVCSASILLRSFKEFGIDASGYLPSRYLDGYGLTVENVKKIAAKGFSIIFTCDNGVTAHEALKCAKELGVEVIILDHHEFDDVKPECDIVIHPETLSYGEYPISAGYLSFLFSEALLKKVDSYLLVLGAISTISDMMPIRGHNREIVRLMLEIVNKEPPEVISLLTDKRIFDVSTFQMEICPKINAVGRLEKGTEINRLLHYFANDLSDKVALARYLNEVNARRKEITKEAEESIEINETDAAIVVKANMPEGLNGLLASKLLSVYKKPVCVFSEMNKNPDVLVGSLRSEEGFDVIEALDDVRVPLLTKGGHPFAAGVSINKKDFEAFKKDMLFSALKHKLSPKKQNYVPLVLGECSMQSYRLIESFGPFGFCWETPKFLLTNLDPSTFTYIKDGKYLSVKISSDVRLFSFEINENSFDLDSKVDLACSFKINEYKGRRSLDILCQKTF
ncbi:MAG: DHH family phosphoesterase [Bacilli bacterium]|nr:DHH family phosphoesterase [Bacilli bacterium]